MGFYRGALPIVARGLISAHDDNSLRCIQGGLLGTTYDIVDGTAWTLGAGSPTVDSNGHIIYGGTAYYASARSYTDQADLTKNIKSSGTGGGTEEYTLEAWINVSSTSTGDTTLGRQILGNNSSLGVGFQLMLNGGLNKINIGYRSNSNDYCDTCDLQVGVWYHVVFTRIDPGTGTACSRLYIDGVQDYEQCLNTFNDVDANSAAMNNSYTSARITDRFEGAMPVRRIYNVGLTQEEVLQNYNAQKDRFQ